VIKMTEYRLLAKRRQDGGYSPELIYNGKPVSSVLPRDLRMLINRLGLNQIRILTNPKVKGLDFKIFWEDLK